MASQSAQNNSPKKQTGRPPTGKRSDPKYVNRSFFIKEETDLDAEAELFKLKRQGVRVDKSELVDQCLRAWIRYRNGESAEECLSDIAIAD